MRGVRRKWLTDLLVPETVLGVGFWPFWVAMDATLRRRPLPPLLLGIAMVAATAATDSDAMTSALSLARSASLSPSAAAARCQPNQWPSANRPRQSFLVEVRCLIHPAHVAVLYWLKVFDPSGVDSWEDFVFYPWA